MAKVYINAQGLFIQVSECSSHSVEQTYSKRWVPLKDATIFKNQHDLSTVNWKGDYDASEVIRELEAEETRIVLLVDKNGS